jgi:hypothetical protein
MFNVFIDLDSKDHMKFLLYSIHKLKSSITHTSVTHDSISYLS